MVKKDRSTFLNKDYLLIILPEFYKTHLKKLGSSNFEEQSRILNKILTIFNNYKICGLGDREFCSIKLANAVIKPGFMFLYKT